MHFPLCAPEVAVQIGAMSDVTIHGAGIFGLSIAWACLKRGARVQVLDPGGVAAGASGGILGALAPHTPENWNPKKAFQLESLVKAGAFWAEVAAAGGGDPGYGRIGRLQPIADAAALERAQARSLGAAQVWGDHACWRVIPQDQAGGFAPPSPTGFLVHDTLSGRLHPRRACEALAAALRTKGCVIARDGAARGAEVWANGVAGLRDLSYDLGAPIGNGVKGQAALLALDRRDQPQLFVDGLHIIPHADGTLAIGSTSERDFDQPTKTDQAVDDLIARARHLVPDLAEAPVLKRWAGVRPRARSRAPMLGPWPGRPGHFVANGGFKIGFGMAPKVADVMAELVLNGRDAIPEGFRVEDNLPKGRT